MELERDEKDESTTASLSKISIKLATARDSPRASASGVMWCRSNLNMLEMASMAALH